MTSLWGLLMAGVRGDTDFVPRAGLEGSTSLPHRDCSRAGTTLGTEGWQSWHSRGEERARSRQGGKAAALHTCVGEHMCRTGLTAHVPHSPAQLSSASPCPGTALPIPALQEHPHGRLGVLISELFSLPAPPLSLSL